MMHVAIDPWGNLVSIELKVLRFKKFKLERRCAGGVVGLLFRW